MPARADWDRERARRMLEEGKTDLEVADAVGCPLTTLRSWKHRAGLTKVKQGDGETPLAKAAPAEGLATKKEQTSVNITLCLAGCKVSIEAPDMERACRALNALRGLENDG